MNRHLLLRFALLTAVMASVVGGAIASGAGPTRRPAVREASLAFQEGKKPARQPTRKKPQPAATARDAGNMKAQLAGLRRSTALLERKLELARGDLFYLVLDPAVPDLALMLRGAELQRYPVLGLQVGRPRVSWVARRTGLGWQGRTWSGGELEPARQADRVVVQAMAPGSESEEDPKPPAIPPTAEEMYQVPSRYYVRFEDGLSIEIRPREADKALGRWSRFRTWWGTKWGDVVAAIFRADTDAVRLRVVLNRRDAESLYRALPPATSLLVMEKSN